MPKHKMKPRLYPKLSRKQLLIFAAIFALIGSFYIYKSFAAPTASANIWVDLNGGSCTRSSTPTGYTDSSACPNLTTALALAQNNDLIMVMGGNYSGGANLALNSAITSQVTIKEASGENAHFGTLGNKSPAVSAPKNVLIDGIDFAHIDFTYNNAVRLTNFTVENTKLDSGGGINVHSSLGLTLKNIEVGPRCCSSDGMVLNADVPNGEPQNENVTIDGMYMHDIARLCAAYPLSNCPGDNTAAHVDCVQVYGINGTLTIKNSRFYNCATQGVFLSPAVGGSFSSATINLENVAVGQVYEAGTSLKLTNSAFAMNLSHVSTSGSIAITSPVPGNYTTRSSLGRLTGNLCVSGVSYISNVWTNAQCSPSDTKVADAGFVNSSVTNADLHILQSSPAIDQADAAYCPAVDFEGTARPQGANCDAGADEYGGGGGGTPAPTVSLSASPTSINSGQSSNLSWNSSNATSCTASGAWSGTKEVSGNQLLSPTSTSTYTLTCTGAGGSGSASATVTVTTANPKPGDLNSDGTVNITDLSILLSSWNTTSATADINKDGTVNILDLSILLSNYGT